MFSFEGWGFWINKLYGNFLYKKFGFFSIKNVYDSISSKLRIWNSIRIQQNAWIQIRIQWMVNTDRQHRWTNEFINKLVLNENYLY